MAILGGALVQRGHFSPRSGSPAAPLGSPEDNVTIGKAAGFAVISAVEVDYPQRFRDFEEFWNIQRQVAGPLALIIKTLPPHEVEAVRAQTKQSAEPFQVGDALSFPSRRILVQAY
jgi:hypothetical protein